MLVQFGNNWIEKIPLTVNFGRPRNFFIQLFPNWTACSPITYTNSAKRSTRGTSFIYFRGYILWHSHDIEKKWQTKIQRIWSLSLCFKVYNRMETRNKYPLHVT